MKQDFTARQVKARVLTPKRNHIEFALSALLCVVNHMHKKCITHWKHSLCTHKNLGFMCLKTAIHIWIYFVVTGKNPYRKTLVKVRISNHKLN